jgi:3-hydroxyethyl bacteriochlorophyllide a dehydrogenase
MDTLAVVFEAPEKLALRRLALNPPSPDDVVVEVDWSGISTGTERLLWTGRMPPFPGLGYPLVPGYESIGRVIEAGANAKSRIGERVFAPGSSGFKDARGLFGGAARILVTPSARVVSAPSGVGVEGVLISLAATAWHAIAGGLTPELIVGHGVLGRLLARLSVLQGGAPVVWETNPDRRRGALGYEVVHPDADARRDYKAIQEVSGDPTILDALIGRLAKGGEITLTGFYEQPLSFTFPPAFMREARLRVAAEFTPADLAAVIDLIADGRLDLSGLVTHTVPATEAEAAYRTAFGDPACLKMTLDWRD